MIAETEHGYLVFADISGYTSFLAKVELQHAHEILTDLLETIIAQFKSLLTISKLEGDAVFAYVNQTQLPRQESLLELAENTYIEFCRHRDSSQRRTTCECLACQSMTKLELKFFIHHGDYIVQHISGTRELVGSDVNLLHRLTKNHISEATHWQAYVLITQAAMQAMQLSLDGLHEQIEAYEYLGEVKTLSYNLKDRYQTLLETRRVEISPQDADLTLTCEFDQPPAQVWQYVTDPKILNLTMRENAHWSIIKRPGGRSGAGAQNHCAHGKTVMAYTYLDWRPFDYYTAEGSENNQKHLEMFQVEPLLPGNRTRFTVRMKVFIPLPHWLRKIFIAYLVKQQFLDFFERTRKLLDEGLDDPGSLNQP